MRTLFLLATCTAAVLLCGEASAQHAELSFETPTPVSISPLAPWAMRGGPAVATPPQSDTPAMERRSTALMVSGIVLATIGTGAVVTGAVMAADGRAKERECNQLMRETLASGGFSFGCPWGGFQETVGYGVV